MVLEISNKGNGVCNEDYKHLKLERQTFEWMIFQDHNMLYSKDNKCSANIVIISLDSLPQILLESVWNFYLQDKFMAFSLSFFALLKDLNRLYFAQPFSIFCCGQNHSYLMPSWIWHFDLENWGEIIQLFISRLGHLCHAYGIPVIS